MQSLHYRFWPRYLPHTMRCPATSLVFDLEVSGARYPQKPLLIYYGTPLAFAYLLAQVGARAGWLQQRCGVRRGDRVLLFMQTSPQFLIGYYAILRADAVVVPVNPMNLTDELHHYVDDSGAGTILTGQEPYPKVHPLLGASGLHHAVVAAYSDYVTQPSDLPLPDAVQAQRQAIAESGVTLWRDALAAQLVPGPHRAGPDDLCVMPYTSGTTDRPKGCVHTHATVMSTVVIGSAWFGAHQGSVILGTLPMFHVTGMQGSMNNPIYTGSTVVLMTRWDRDTAARLIERYRVKLCS